MSLISSLIYIDIEARHNKEDSERDWVCSTMLKDHNHSNVFGYSAISAGPFIFSVCQARTFLSSIGKLEPKLGGLSSFDPAASGLRIVYYNGKSESREVLFRVFVY